MSDLTDNLKTMQTRKKEKEGEIHTKGEEFTKLKSKIEELRNARGRILIFAIARWISSCLRLVLILGFGRGFVQGVFVSFIVNKTL